MRILSPLRCARTYPILFRNEQIAIICFFLLVSGLSPSAQGQQPFVPKVGAIWQWKGETEAGTRLLEAVDQGDPNRVRELLKNGADPNTRHKGAGGWPNGSVLCLAVAHSTTPHPSPHPAVSPKFEEIVEALIDKGADASDCSLQNVGDINILKLCLAHGANAKNDKPLDSALTRWHDDPKYWLEVIRLLLQAGADPNWESPARGSRSLFFPAPALMPAVPAPGLFTELDKTSPLSKAFLGNQLDYDALVGLLVHYGARVNERWVYLKDRACGYSITDSGSGLTCWTYYADARTCGPSPQPCPADRIERVDSGVTPLIQASRARSGLPYVKSLLSVGADPMLTDADNCTALDGAANPAIHAVLEQAVRLRIGASAALPLSSCKPSTVGVTFKTSPPTVEKRQTDKIDFLCFKEVVGAHRESVGSSAKTTFGDKQFLIVSVEGSPASLLSEAAAEEITRELLLSISLWRKTCTKCSTGNASVVRVNGSTYVNATFLGAAKSIDYEHGDVGGKYLGTTVPTPYSSPLFENRLLTFGSLPQYVKVAERDPFISRLCSVPSDKLPLDLLGLREAFGCGITSASSSTSLKIRLLNGATRCSPPDKVEDVVGCEVGNLEIELNATQFKYVKHGTSELVFGTGADTIDLEAVLLHEMGHWAGISQHLTSPSNIMSQYVQDCKCIDEAVIKELAKSTTVTQASGNVALRYKRDSRSN
jgi:ankyrin repeat protein